MNYPNSYYAATLNDDTGYSALSEAIDAQVCIVGGGYAGLMVAMGLVERGVKDIVILEQHRVGWGASGRNGGFVFGGFSLGPEAMAKQVGLEKARQLYQCTTQAVDLIRERVKKYSINCDLVDEGVILANWFKEQKSLLEMQSFMNQQMGVDWQYLPPDVLSEKIASERYCGGLFEPNAMHFHPLNYARGITQELSSQGVKIFEQSAVIETKTNGTTKTITTDHGKVSCKHLVVTGGGYINRAFPALSRSILPIATYVMATEPLGDRLKASLSTKAAIYDTRFAFDYYRPLQDSRLLWGGRISAKTKEPEQLADLLKRDMVRVFPEFNDVKVDYCWQGYMGYARHQMAQIGQLQNGVWYSNGFGGHGVAPTTAAGEIIAAAIAEKDTFYQAFSKWRLPWNGGVFGPAAAQLSYWGYQSLDWMKEKLQG